MCETVGPYRILQECGRGSYGVVYLAQNTYTGQKFALKILNGKVEKRELEGLIRCRECRHGNLIQIHHIDRLPDGRLYYTMDAADDRGAADAYLPDTLAARGRMRAAELLPILRALLDGVAALHKRKLIHRDIKPENILFVNNTPVLGDIGLAAPSGDASLVGTPSFLPPEVLSGARKPDERSDLYALGRVAYCVLTGNPPHKYPQLPEDLTKEAAPVLAFCRAASAGDATPDSCRAALTAPPRSKSLRCLIGLPLLGILAAALVFALFSGRGRRELMPPPEPEKKVPAPAQVRPSPVQKQEIPVPPTGAGIDAALRQTQTELEQRMRSLDAGVAASQTRMRSEMRMLTPEAYQTAVAELEKRYPVSPELLERAKNRFDAVRREHFRKLVGLSPFTADGAAARARLTEKLKRLEAKDALYRLGCQDDALKNFSCSSGTMRRGGDLSRFEELFRKRHETAEQLSHTAPRR